MNKICLKIIRVAFSACRKLDPSLSRSLDEAYYVIRNSMDRVDPVRAFKLALAGRKIDQGQGDKMLIDVYETILTCSGKSSFRLKDTESLVDKHLLESKLRKFKEDLDDYFKYID